MPKRKAAQAAAVKAKRARGETELGWDLSWHDAGAEQGGDPPALVLSSSSLPGCEKVAGFDVDSTIIKTKSGRKFAAGVKDWTWWDQCVPGKLAELDNSGFRVVFFTNQAGIEKMKVTADELRSKVEDIISKLGIPIFCFVSTGTNHFRKPATTMWDYFVQHCNQGVQVDKSQSIYVGDAAGRPKDWAPGQPKDFSCSDRMFAANIGIGFMTPEEFFLGTGDDIKFSWGSVDPNQLLKTIPKATGKETFHSMGQEMVVMVGVPAAGKSTFCRRYLLPHGYVHVNRDTLHTPAKCFKAVEAALAKGKSVVVDNTNPSAASRADYINIAKSAGVPCRCFFLKTPLDVAKHLNLMRMTQTAGKVRRIPDVGYNMYKKNLEEPKPSEGFTEVKHINFTIKFDTTMDEKLFKQWTV